jgi:hypothetical protein
MSNSCRSAAVLGGHSSDVQDVAFAYGKHLGLAFQLVRGRRGRGYVHVLKEKEILSV